MCHVSHAITVSTGSPKLLLRQEYKELAISFDIRNAIASFIDTQIIQPRLLIVKNFFFPIKAKGGTCSRPNVKQFSSVTTFLSCSNFLALSRDQMLCNFLTSQHF